MLSSTLVWAISSRNTLTHTQNVYGREPIYLSVSLSFPATQFLSLFFFSFLSFPPFIYRPKKESKEEEPKENLHLGCKAHFAKCTQRPPHSSQIPSLPLPALPSFPSTLNVDIRPPFIPVLFSSLLFIFPYILLRDLVCRVDVEVDAHTMCSARYDVDIYST